MGVSDISVVAESFAGGRGYIAATIPTGGVTVNGAPADRRVLIVHRATSRLIVSTTSDPSGHFYVEGLDPSQQFDVIGQDWLGVYNDVIAARIYPYAAPYLGGLELRRIDPGETISIQLAAVYGELPYTWSATGLPGWLSLSSAGLLTGTAPGVESTTLATITCTDAHGEAGSIKIPIKVRIPVVYPTRWRVLFLASNSSPNYASLQEMEFRATIGGASLCVGGAASASSSYVGYPPSKAFDGDTTTPGVTYWAADGVEATPWLEYEFATGSPVNQLMICAAVSSPAAAPKDFKVQSYDGSGWVDEWSVTGSTGWSGGTIRTFNRP